MAETTDEPQAPPARYFTHPEGSLQAVHGLADPAPYLDAGYDEVDEETYRAALTAPYDGGAGA